MDTIIAQAATGANAAAIPSGAGRGDVILAASGTLNLNGNSQTINGLYGSGFVDNLTGTATVTFSTTATTLQQNIQTALNALPQIGVSSGGLNNAVANNWIKVKERDRYTYVLTEAGFLAGRALTIGP